MMADCSVVCVFLSIFLSSRLQPGCCQYQQIDLTSSSSGVTCSMDSIFKEGFFGNSLNCTGTINGKTSTEWTPTRDPIPNCIYTNGGDSEHYWQVNLGQTRNIHRITIYPDTKWDYMRGIRVLVDGNQVFQFPTNAKVETTTNITPDPPISGRIIKLTNNGYIGLCELEVYGCRSGRYGAECQETCSAGCETCDSIAGDCTCRPGWSSPPQCQDCADGYYGASCSETCSTGCRDTCNKQDGTCNCRTGWSGTECEDCSTGYYKKNGNCVRCAAGCQGGTCDVVTGSCNCRLGWQTPVCQVCVAGRYGTNCQQYCGAGCSTTTCNKDSGECTCRTGWATPRCDVCSSGYYRQGDNCVRCGAGCQAGTCRDNGECDCRTTNWQTPLCQTCIPGRYGTNCDMECSAGCANTCNTVSGGCMCRTGWTGPKCDVCADGYYGASCGETCSTGCSNTCNKQDGTCNCRTGWSGDKCDECAPGQFGDDCQLTCSVGCENICDLNTGRCTCRQGWVGLTCETCATDYYNKSESGDPIPGDCIPCGSGCSDTCDGQSGYCTCQPGWEPPFCDQMCEANTFGQNCSSSCAPGCDGTCDAVIGNCTCGSQWIQPDCTVCSPGYYSPDEGCELCNDGCENVTSCDPTTGACQACSPGFYGDTCFSPCTNCAGNGICSKQMGECETGCVEGWTGPACAQPLKTGGGDNGSTNTGAIVGAVLGAGVFIGIIVGALLIIRSRRSRASSQSEQFNGNMTSSVQETETAVDFPGESDTHNEAAASEQAWDDSNNYDMLRSYENSDDIKLYTSLQTNQSSTRRPDALNPAPRDTRVYEIPDVVYENTRTDNLT